MESHSLDVLNTSVGLMSLILGGFAIWLSWEFYSKAKDAEKQTAVTLEAIKAQSDALQRLTGRWMDRFTRYATEPRPADEGLMMLVNTMANLPTTILTHLRVQTTTTSPSTTPESLITEVVDCYIALYHWTAIANVGFQALLPLDSFDEAVPEHANLKRIIDGSFNDFSIVANALSQVPNARLHASKINHLLIEAQATWRPLVRDTASALAVRRM